MESIHAIKSVDQTIASFAIFLLAVMIAYYLFQTIRQFCGLRLFHIFCCMEIIRNSVAHAQPHSQSIANQSIYDD